MFKKDFVWGVASSAYQIEGRAENDGCGRCIWDDYLDTGIVNQGQNAQVTCDHIHHYKEDFALMRAMGVKHYRFSINWSRVLPEGTGKVNEVGLQFYKDLVREMKKNGITPYITLFHWDFPVALEEKGGWLNPESVNWFAEYAALIAEHFSEECEYFITLNEPQCFIGLGYLREFHAPGKHLPDRDLLSMIHHALMAHGAAVKAMRRAAKRPIKIGYAPTCGVALPASDKEEDIAAAKKRYLGMNEERDNWTWTVTWFVDPVVLGTYPEEGRAYFGEALPEFSKEDMELIHQPIDFLGQNIYNGYQVKAADNELGYAYVQNADGFPKTACGWPQTPTCLYWGPKFLYERYKLPIYITENGMSCHDIVTDDGKVHDNDRIQFLDKYLTELQRAVEEGVPVEGYFLWTFLDNFEWDKGYNERFGLVYVDYATQKRTVKDSAYWYKKVMETGGEILSGNHCKREMLFLEPVFKEVVWGGTRLREQFGYPVEGDQIGECWGISGHKNGDCRIAGGTYDGMHLSQVYEQYPELFGGHEAQGQFPLLVKIIDASDKLSIQVHPDDAYAQVHENGSLGKTECWYVLDCPEGAELVIGHNAKTREELIQMIEENRYEELIRRVPVRKGDFIQIEPGTIHAITEGLLILETQQSSDITYRVYDYDRQPPRPLHVRQSMEVTTVPGIPRQQILSTASCPKNELMELISCDFYKVWKLDLTSAISIPQTHDFMQISVVEGDGVINGTFVKKGTHLIVPCSYGRVDFSGTMQLIISVPGGR